MRKKVLTDYILHAGDTGNGTEVALLWIHGQCPIPGDAEVHLSHPLAPSGDLIIRFADNEITLKSVVADCYGMVRTTAGLHIIHQDAQVKPESFFLRLAER